MPLSPVQYSGISHSLLDGLHITPCFLSWLRQKKIGKKRIFLCSHTLWTVWLRQNWNTLQLSQQRPLAHSASTFNLHVIPSQHGSSSHSSRLPQSHCSSSSIILFPQLRLISNCFNWIGRKKEEKQKNYLNGNEILPGQLYSQTDTQNISLW